MKTIALFTTILLLSFNSYSQVWQWTHPEPNGIIHNVSSYPLDIESDLVHDVEKDTYGNIYVLGDCNDSLYLNNTFISYGNGSYIAKYGAAGNLIWYQLIKPVTNYYPYPMIRATRMCVNATGIFITGIFKGDGAAATVHQISNLQFRPDTLENGTDLFLTKLNLSNGNVVWLKQSHVIVGQNGDGKYSGLIEYEPVVTSDKKNNVLLGFDVGTTNTVYKVGSDIITIGVGNGYMSIALIKYNSAGSLSLVQLCNTNW